MVAVLFYGVADEVALSAWTLWVRRRENLNHAFPSEEQIIEAGVM